jgi:hypothetical protein
LIAILKRLPHVSPGGLTGREGAFLSCGFWLVDNPAYRYELHVGTFLPKARWYGPLLQPKFFLAIDLEATLSIMVDAETGERGYIISGDETFLEPYRAALDGINEHIKELKQLTADNPNQQAHLPLLERKIADRLDYLKRQIASRGRVGSVGPNRDS